MPVNFCQIWKKFDIYYILLVFIAVSLPLSKFTFNFFTILLVLNWIIEGGFREKIVVLKNRKSIQVILLIYFIHVLWLLFTNDFNLAFHELNIKLPFLIFPIVIGTSKPLYKKQIETLFFWYSGAVIIAGGVALAGLYGVISFREYQEHTGAILFIHHIRFGVLLAIAIIMQLYWIVKKGILEGKYYFYLIIISVIFLFFVLISLKILTGIAILLGSSLILLFIYLWKIKIGYLRFIFAVLLISLPVFSALYIYFAVQKYYTIEKVDFSTLEKKTQSGNTYVHDTLNGRFENGNYVRLYICKKELEQEWNKKSELDFNGQDLKNQSLYATLIRYMSSKGLRKDSAGISLLTVNDIKNVENGYSNYLFTKKGSLYPRIYQIIWEIDEYKRSGEASGHSLTQRYVYYGITINLIKEHWLLGVGTGDTKSIYNLYYKENNTGLKPEFQHESHNQFLRFTLEFGIIGFIIIMFCFVYPVHYERKWQSFYFVAIFIIIFLSFVNEDTLEMQVGAALVAYFYSLFLFGMKSKNIKKTSL